MSWAGQAMSKRQRAPAGTGMYIAGELEYACTEKAVQGERVLNLYEEQVGALNQTMEDLMALIRQGRVTQFMGEIVQQKRAVEREIELRSSISDFTFASPRQLHSDQPEENHTSTTATTVNNTKNNINRSPKSANYRHTADPFLSPTKASATLTPKSYRASDTFVRGSASRPSESSGSTSLSALTRTDGSPASNFPNPDSSIEAIQLNIRESMKRRLTMKANEVAVPSIHTSSKSSVKTPSRTSLFMKLPAKTPILDGVSWKSTKGASKSRKVAERLEAEIAKDLHLSPVVVPRVISSKNLELQLQQKLRRTEHNVSSQTKLRLSRVPTLVPQSSSSSISANSKGTESSGEPQVRDTKSEAHSSALSLTNSQAESTPKFVIRHPHSTNKQDNTHSRVSHPSLKITPARIRKSPHKSPTKSTSNFTSPTTSSSLKSKKEPNIKSTDTTKPEVKRHPQIKTTNRLLNTELKTDLPPSILTLRPLILPPRDESPNTLRKSRHEIEAKFRSNLGLDANGIPQLRKETTEGTTPLKIARPPSYSYNAAKEFGANKKVEDLAANNRRVGTSGSNIHSATKIPDNARETNRQHRPLKGNAVPLPEAARGKVTASSRNMTRTPHRLANGTEGPNTPLYKRNQRDTTVATNSALPDFGSDDEAPKNSVMKEWAKDTNLEAMIAEQHLVNPATIFGEIPEFDIDEVFDTYESRARARKSPMQWSTVERRKDEKRYARQMGFQ